MVHIYARITYVITLVVRLYYVSSKYRNYGIHVLQTSQPGSKPGREKVSNRLSCSSKAMQNSSTYIFYKNC